VTPASITVYIVDDQPSVGQALARLVQSSGMYAKVFGAVPQLIGVERFEQPGCVIADIRMPHTSGLELPRLLAQKGYRLPVIFVTACDTAQNWVAAKRAGATAFFRKVESHP
jgi:FixJ family two-component response regulator